MLLPLMVRETVAVDTLARLATSVMFIGKREHVETNIISKRKVDNRRVLSSGLLKHSYSLRPSSWPADDAFYFCRNRIKSDTPRGAGGLVSGAASKAVVPLVEASR